MSRAVDRRAAAIAAAGGLDEAIERGALARRIDTTLAEVVVLGLLRQGVRQYLVVFGHGSTELGEVLRIYSAHGVVRTRAVHHETLAAHAAAALRWVTGEKAAVVTSIGPGALHALAGSLAAASDGIGVWHLYGDETTEDEGPNLQQIPKERQHLYQQLTATMGESYLLHTPTAVGTALRRGLVTVDHPYRPGPFYLLLPMNSQPARLEHFNLDELPSGSPPLLGAAAGDYDRAVAEIRRAERIVVRIGGGARQHGAVIADFLEQADAVAVVSPVASGALPEGHPRNMTVGGSKGSISGNFAMENADLLVALGTRAVCQSDCSRTGYPHVGHVVNVNADVHAAMHYGRTTALVGDVGPTVARLTAMLHDGSRSGEAGSNGAVPRHSEWFRSCRAARRAWDEHRRTRYERPVLFDEVWQAEVLTQPAAVRIVTDWARARGSVMFFDAGDVQANGFQVGGDDRPGQTFTETGASYMGFAVSAVVASGLAAQPFHAVALTGDGSFLMQPQVLLDGVLHGASGTIVVLDNRRMGAISGLQRAQYGAGHDHATDHVGIAIDWLALARAFPGVYAFDGGRDATSLEAALDEAARAGGLGVVHVPVYFGGDPRGGLGAFGRWNVGSWVPETQALRHQIGL